MDLSILIDGGIDEATGLPIQYDVTGITIIPNNPSKGRKAVLTVHAEKDLITPSGKLIPSNEQKGAGYRLDEGKISVDVDGATLYKVVRDEQGNVVYTDGKPTYLVDENGDKIPRDNAAISLIGKLKLLFESELIFGMKEFHKLFE